MRNRNDYPRQVDDWPKGRTKGQRLSREERLFIRDARAQGYAAREVARSLGCASRNVFKHYKRLRLAEEVTKPRRATAGPAPSRFYTSNFELS